MKLSLVQALGLALFSQEAQALTPGRYAVRSTNSTTSNSTSAALLADGNVDFGIFAGAYAKAVALVAKMNNTQKAAVITSQSVTTSDAKWEAMSSIDGAGGILYAFFVSAFALPNALGMTWDRQHIADSYTAFGAELYGRGYNMLNAPQAGPLGRTAWSGRLMASFGSDPYLTGIAMEKAVSSLVAANVVADGKHWLLNEQETNREGLGTTPAYSANVDDKALHELYMWPFADGIRVGMGSVMCAMNQVNSTYACENSYLVNHLLKTELGFLGNVRPDVGAQFTSYGSANAGLDLGSSSFFSAEIIEAGIANGSLSQARLDDMAVRSVMPWYFVGLDSLSQPSLASVTEYRDVRGNHSSLIRTIGADSLVLLKNVNTSGGGLPLNKPLTISLFGAHAGPAQSGPTRSFSVSTKELYTTFAGHLASGGGSDQGSFSYLKTPYEAISSRVIDYGGLVRWILNDSYPTSEGQMPQGVTQRGTMGDISYASFASSAKACLVFINAYSGEGSDRSELTNANQDSMVTTVAATCNNTIVIINTPGPRLVDQWISNDNVTAVLYGGLLGQESGDAIADVLFGDVNPSGKLAHTLAKNESDYNAAVCAETTCDFTEGSLVDYRYFDSKNVTPRYEFGYGLSYTTFAYASSVSVAVTNQTALASRYPTGRLAVGGVADLFDTVATVNASVSNTGSVAGAEVAQLYVGFPTEAGQAPRVLRGFDKVTVQPGASADVSFTLRRRDLSYWDVAAQQWALANGTYTFYVGASSRDIRATATLTV